MQIVGEKQIAQRNRSRFLSATRGPIVRDAQRGWIDERLIRPRARPAPPRSMPEDVLARRHRALDERPWPQPRNPMILAPAHGLLHSLGHQKTRLQTQASSCNTRLLIRTSGSDRPRFLLNQN